MSMLRSSSMQRREYAVRDLSPYNLPELPKGYYWKLWIPTFYHPRIAFLELRRRFLAVYEVVDNTMIMADTTEELPSSIHKQALLLAVLRVYNIRMYDEHPSGSYVLEETYAMWKTLQDKLPAIPSAYLWELNELSAETFEVILKKKILRSENTRVIRRSTCPRIGEIESDSTTIAEVAQSLYVERFLS